MISDLPFRLGSTSYVYPADILPNVAALGSMVDDVELVLFEVAELSNLPSPETIHALNALAGEYDLTYTVHLPLDLQLAAGDDVWRSPSMEKARRVIGSTLPLHPWAFIVHLDGREIENGAGSDALALWRDQAARSLESIAQEAGDPALLAVENLENYDPAAFLPLLDLLPVSLCIDVGHFYKNEQDPLPYLAEHLDRARVLHLHGSSEGRDHRGLDLVADRLPGVLQLLSEHAWSGVLTLEVFTQRHFFPGRELILGLAEGNGWHRS